MKIDWLVIGIIFFILIIVVTSQYLYNIQNRKCIADPLGYSVRYYEKHYGEVAYGILYFENGNKPYSYITFSKDGMNYTVYG